MLKPLRRELIRLAKSDNGFIKQSCCNHIKGLKANKWRFISEGFVEDVLNKDGELLGIKVNY